MQISNSLFAMVARETVPKLRQALDELGVDGASVTPSLAMTATIEIDGRDERVRMTVELDPEEDDDAD